MTTILSLIESLGKAVSSFGWVDEPTAAAAVVAVSPEQQQAAALPKQALDPAILAGLLRKGFTATQVQSLWDAGRIQII